MARIRFPRFFRAAALIVTAALIAGMAELVIADVCDAQAASVTATIGPAPSTTAGADLGGRAKHAPESPHTCHCVHAHVITLPSTGNLAASPRVFSPEFISVQRVPASFPPEPHFRPPVA